MDARVVLRVVVLIRLTRFGRQRLLGRNLITVFFTVNTRVRFFLRRRRRRRRPSRRLDRWASWRWDAQPTNAFQSDAENKCFFLRTSARPRFRVATRRPPRHHEAPFDDRRGIEKKKRGRRFPFASHKPICAELRKPGEPSRRLHAPSTELDDIIDERSGDDAPPPDSRHDGIRRRPGYRRGRHRRHVDESRTKENARRVAGVFLRLSREATDQSSPASISSA